jgi:(2S)-methylsuccinyl-CoA dehydrogenase
VNTVPVTIIEALTTMVTGLRAVFRTQVSRVARACCVDGVLEPELLDRWQLPSYELAFAAAELLAAETVLRRSVAAGSELRARLGVTFAAELCRGLLARLRQVALDLADDATAPDLTDDATAPDLTDVATVLGELAADSGWQALCRSVLSGRALDEMGRRVCESQEEIGAIDLAPDLLLAQNEFRRVAAQVVGPLATQIHRQDLTVPEALLAPLREMGVFGLSIPESFGGTANDEHADLMMIVVTEALSEASLAAAGSLITRPEILARALLAGGTAQQKSHWLPLIASGDPLCAIAITEPDYGSDVAGLQLKATRVEGGWLLDGTKTWCTFAGKAGLLMVVARTSPDRALGHRGLSLLLVEKPSYDGHAFDHRPSGGGRLLGKAIPTIGYRGMHSFDLSFEQLFVPEANLVGEAAGMGRGFYFTMAGMVGGRMQTAARALGVMRAALLAARRHAADRKVFKAPLASYSLTRAKLARMAAQFAGCRELTYAVGGGVHDGDGRLESSLIKLFACRSAEWLTREALQIHGASGYAEETPVSRYFVDARVLSIFEGAEETLALKVVARGLFEQALETLEAGTPCGASAGTPCGAS